MGCLLSGLGHEGATAQAIIRYQGATAQAYSQLVEVKEGATACNHYISFVLNVHFPQTAVELLLGWFRA
jgi:hypothetical protein